MKIKKELIGSKVFCSVIRRFILIEEGNEDKYSKLGLDVFEKRKSPKLKKNAKNTEIGNDIIDSDSNGTDNVDES
tara:strand:- start:196 stop:420 length:225 start_codon:yes stop_codon:yes gene_type:complete